MSRRRTTRASTRRCRSRRRKSGKAGVCAVTHVDVIPPQRENGTAAVKQLAEDSRKHAGNIRFDVFVQTNRPNHFTVVECWKDRKAFDAHVAAKETKAFRDKLVSMTGALYDERLYKAVGLTHDDGQAGISPACSSYQSAGSTQAALK